MLTQAAKAQAFAALHAQAGAFIIPNPWDTGTARLLATIGFEALATTSAGYAFSVGRPDNILSRDDTIAHAATIASATGLPVSADLENGFGDDPESVAETRHGLPFRFMLTARAENFLVGRPDLSDTIKRLQAYQEAGADVLYAPGLQSPDDIAAVARSVNRPMNVVMGLAGAQLSLATLSALGVKRISIGSALARAALGAVLRAGRYLKGVVSRVVASTAAAAARRRGIPFLVDPKVPHVDYYSGATVITPNHLEAEAVAQMRIRTGEDALAAARRFRDRAGCDSVLITRGEHGMTLLGPTEQAQLAAEAREVADVTGAGDTVIATMTLALAAGASLLDAARLANKAAGVVVGKFGPATVSIDELANE